MHLSGVFAQLSVLAATASAFALPPQHDFVLRGLSNNGSNSSTDATCNLGGGVSANQVAAFDMKAFTAADLDEGSLDARAPTVIPLKSPADFGGSRTRFLEYLQGVEGDDDIDITPTDEQLATWMAGSGRRAFPIGATAIWRPFGSRYRRFKMRGLSGCTATFLVNPEGLWAGHLWENTRSSIINGGSAFNKRTSATAYSERSASEFDACAVDILDERTPTAERQNRVMWTSLKDLEGSRFRDPFRDSSTVRGFVFTKAKSGRDASQKYRTKISALTSEYQRILPDMRLDPTVTYPGTSSEYPRGFPLQLKGTVGMQYSPCASIQSGRCVARFEAYTEYSATPKLVHQWFY